VHSVPGRKELGEEKKGEGEEKKGRGVIGSFGRERRADREGFSLKEQAQGSLWGHQQRAGRHGVAANVEADGCTKQDFCLCTHVDMVEISDCRRWIISFFSLEDNEYSENGLQDCQRERK
jgi:hypothetical protein